jgi:hypothetical protein
MAAPPPPSAAPAPDKNAKDNKDKKKDQKPAAAAPAPATNYPFEDVFVPRGQAGRAGASRCAFSAASACPRAATICISSCTSGSSAPPAPGAASAAAPAATGPALAGKTSVLKQPLAVPELPGMISRTSTGDPRRARRPAGDADHPDAQSEHPYAFGQTEIVVAPDHKFKKSQELIVLLQIYNPM